MNMLSCINIKSVQQQSIRKLKDPYLNSRQKTTKIRNSKLNNEVFIFFIISLKI